MSGVLIDSLAEYPEDSYLDCAKLAETLGVSTRTISRMVKRYELPQGIKNGRRKLWRAGMVLGRMKLQEQKNIEELEQQQRRIEDYGGNC